MKRKILTFVCFCVVLSSILAVSTFAASDPEITYNDSFTFGHISAVGAANYSHQYVTFAYEYADAPEAPDAYFEYQPMQWKTKFLWIGEWELFGTPMTGEMRDWSFNYASLANPNKKMRFQLTAYMNIFQDDWLGEGPYISHDIVINTVRTFSSNTLY